MKSRERLMHEYRAKMHNKDLNGGISSKKTEGWSKERKNATKTAKTAKKALKTSEKPYAGGMDLYGQNASAYGQNYANSVAKAKNDAELERRRGLPAWTPNPNTAFKSKKQKEKGRAAVAVALENAKKYIVDSIEVDTEAKPDGTHYPDGNTLWPEDQIEEEDIPR